MVSALLIGASAKSTVVETVAVLESQGAFDAGRGAVLTRDGTVELDAGVMDATWPRMLCFKARSSNTASMTAVPSSMRFVERPEWVSRADMLPEVTQQSRGALGVKT